MNAVSAIMVDGVTGDPFIGVAADASTAKYVLPEGQHSDVFTDARIQSMAQSAGQTTTTPQEWIKLAGRSLGYAVVGRSKEADSLDAAVEAVRAALAAVQ